MSFIPYICRLFKFSPNKTKYQILTKDKFELACWIKNDLYLPPPDVVKFNMIKKYAIKEKLKTLCAASKMCENRKLLLEDIFRQIAFINTDKHGKIDFTSLNKLMSNFRLPSLFYFDSDVFLSFESKSQVLNHFFSLIDLIFKDKENHVLLLDDTHLYDGIKLPTVHELKQLLMAKRNYYGNIKSENNIFVFAPKL